MSTKKSAPRLIDPRSHRFGAGLSVLILAGAFVIGQPVLVGLIALALAVSAALGTRYSALGRPWPLLRGALDIGPPAQLEQEYPPRFAQALGAGGLTLGLVFFALNLPLAGWLLTAAVAALQALLALTGYCLGCRLYFLRWWLPAAFARLVGAQTRS